MAKGFNSRGLGGMGGGMNMNMIKQAQKMRPAAGWCPPPSMASMS